MSALAQVIDHLDEDTIRKMILPKTKQLFDIDTKVRRTKVRHRWDCSLLFFFFWWRILEEEKPPSLLLLLDD